jgi:hypothetical protein
LGRINQASTGKTHASDLDSFAGKAMQGSAVAVLEGLKLSLPVHKILAMILRFPTASTRKIIVVEALVCVMNRGLRALTETNEVLRIEPLVSLRVSVESPVGGGKGMVVESQRRIR